MKRKIDFSNGITLMEMFDLVRDLSKQEPYINTNEWCRFCSHGGRVHKKDCVWQRANEMITRNNTRLPSPNVDISKVRET